MSSLNPQIQTMEIGIRSIRTVTIYPLSMADQFKLSAIVTKVIAENDFGDEEGKESPSDIEIFKIITEAIEENLIQILDFITDENEKITLDDLSNTQFADLVTTIYDVNYGSAIVKFKGLFEKAKKVFQLKRPSQTSSSKPHIDMNTSSDSHTEKVE